MNMSVNYLQRQKGITPTTERKVLTVANQPKPAGILGEHRHRLSDLKTLSIDLFGSLTERSPVSYEDANLNSLDMQIGTSTFQCMFMSCTFHRLQADTSAYYCASEGKEEVL
ncbi:hypothetical protein CEXT_333871 [Caerostris extrusa]|uniref:Uncharacterized protein n=1 Tax=Caerostris extrusa TaxID=172846 RepID=A0AAV4N5T9_CAEEX|nr:hypothetical protein CEXT_333871 [Caerostris extrusa]